MAVVQLIASLGMALSIATPSYAGNGQREQTVARILELSSFATDQGNVGILIYPRLRYGHPIRLENCLAHIETWSVRAGGGTYLRSETILDLRHVSVPNPTSADFPTDMTALGAWSGTFNITAHDGYRWKLMDYSTQPPHQSEGSRMSLITLSSRENPERFLKLVDILWAYQTEYCTLSG